MLNQILLIYLVYNFLVLVEEIITKVNRVFKLKERGIKVIFPDVDRIAQKLLDELAKK